MEKEVYLLGPVCPFPLMGSAVGVLPLTSHLMISGHPGSSVGSPYEAL